MAEAWITDLVARMNASAGDAATQEGVVRASPAPPGEPQALPLVRDAGTAWLREADVGLVGVLLADSGQADGVLAGTTPPLVVEVHRNEATAQLLILVRFREQAP